MADVRLVRVVNRAAATAIGLALASRAVVAPAVAHAGTQCAPAGPAWHGTPWQQQVLAPVRVSPFADGSGVVVAVLSSGVDAAQPQLAGSVEPGFDALAGHGTADDDCAGTGTKVAGTIAAHDDPSGATSTGIVGIAPKAGILPIRVSDGTGQPDQGVDPKVLAGAITFAVAHGAGVIDIAEPAYHWTPELQAAVANAAARNVVIVVAAGSGAGHGDPAATPFPAATPADPAVLVVGAVDSGGHRWTNSPAGAFIGLVAPGVGTVCIERGGGVSMADGTDVASGFVAGAAALVRQRQPDASAAAVADQLTATATPVGAPGSAEYGHGLVNPYSAVEARLVPAHDAVPGPAIRAPVPRVGPKDQGSGALAASASALALTVALALVLGRAVVVRGRRVRWRPSAIALTLTWPEPDEPGPPLELFGEPRQDKALTHRPTGSASAPAGRRHPHRLHGGGRIERGPGRDERDQ